MEKKTAVIIGAGPAGLTAAYELLNAGIKPVVYEMTGDIGGISKTVNYKGNRIDIGGHRFFSKSDRVMDWWKGMMPLQGAPSKDDQILKRDVSLSGEKSADPEKTDKVMLIRSRLSRIFFLRKFFDYPVTLNKNTLSNLGPVRVAKIAASYAQIRLFPIKEEKSLEDFFINRFGRELYLTFFKDYTEKVWGVPCDRIKPEWGAQRIKGLSVSKVIAHAIKKTVSRGSSLSQKDIETSFIEKFLYPIYGPGQMWETVAEKIKEKGGVIHMSHQVVGIGSDGDTITEVTVKDPSGRMLSVKGDYFFSTIPVKDLIGAWDKQAVPEDVRRVASGLVYRDFITMGLLLSKMKIKNATKYKTVNDIVPDNWIYLQDRDVKVGRLQIFNNWSPYLVKDADTMWIGLEYFCNEGDDLWNMKDEEFARFAISELARIDLIEEKDILDKVVIRMPKTYPAYFGTYEEFGVVREYVDRFENLFLIGRNGMHRYNNMDHSMLTAMTAVGNIVNSHTSKDNIWDTNTEKEYHEQKR